MPSYDIYIHTDSATAIQKEKKPTEATAKEITGATTNPLGSLGSLIPKALPIVIGMQVLNQVVDTVIPMAKTLTGNYTLERNLTNVKSVISNFSNPISMATNIATKLVDQKVYNDKISLERELTGNSIVNSYGGKGS